MSPLFTCRGVDQDLVNGSVTSDKSRRHSGESRRSFREQYSNISTDEDLSSSLPPASAPVCVGALLTHGNLDGRKIFKMVSFYCICPGVRVNTGDRKNRRRIGGRHGERMPAFVARNSESKGVRSCHCEVT